MCLLLSKDTCSRVATWRVRTIFGAMPAPVRVLLRLFLLALLTGLLFRGYLLLAHTAQWRDASTGHLLRAFVDRGLLFDAYVGAWLLVLPTLLLGLRHLLGSNARWPVVVARACFTLLFLVVLFLACADVPFYAYTNMRLTDMALSTAQTVQQSLKELVSTPPYLLALGAFAALAFMAVRLIKRAFAPCLAPAPTAPLARRALTFVGLVLLVGTGVRGTLDPRDAPLLPEDAYFSDTPFLNQLATNAPYNFVASMATEHVAYLPASEALANVRRYLHLGAPRYTSPIARAVTYPAPAARRNVVLILVESLSAQRLQRFGYPKRLMPFLEGLMDSSLVFDRFYSAGTRTCNGIFSTLYGLPAVGAQHPLAHPTMTAQRFHGLPGTLRAAGYRTSFLYPGDPRFDNMLGFLPANGFQQFVAQDAFPASIPRNSWGVTDHALYTRTLAHLDSLHHAGAAPFFATVMTISSHKGYNVPDDLPGFAPTSTADDEDIYEYADRALATFFAAARRAPWYANTVFVLLGDHGQRFDPLYEVPLAYHHVPLVVHAPGLAVPGTVHGWGTQADVPATVLGLLRQPHVDNTLGLDLLQRTHPLAYFCSDERLCALNDSSYWIRTGEVERLFDHTHRSTVNAAAQRTADLHALRTYTMSMVQAAQWLVDEKLLGPPVLKEVGP